MTIEQWIADPSDFNKGVELYEKYGSNASYLLTLKQRGESEHMRNDLIYELGKCIVHLEPIGTANGLSLDYLVMDDFENNEDPPAEGDEGKKLKCNSCPKQSSLTKNGACTTKKARFSIPESVLNRMKLNVKKWPSGSWKFSTIAARLFGKRSTTTETTDDSPNSQ